MWWAHENAAYFCAALGFWLYGNSLQYIKPYLSFEKQTPIIN